MLTLTKLTIIITINRSVIIVKFCNHFDKALTEIFQFRRALILIDYLPNDKMKLDRSCYLSQILNKCYSCTKVIYFITSIDKWWFLSVIHFPFSGKNRDEEEKKFPQKLWNSKVEGRTQCSFRRSLLFNWRKKNNPPIVLQTFISLSLSYTHTHTHTHIHERHVSNM